jgi:uncharacterized DUF497 family protein
MQFEWNEVKNKANKKKHKVSFEVAKLIFDDPYIISVLEAFWLPEERWNSIGFAADTVLLFVAHTGKEDEYGKEVIGILSARKAEKNEREKYLYGHSKNAKRARAINFDA